MDSGQGGRDDFGFGPFGGFGHGFGRPTSLFPSLFGGRDPFDDPFFTQPFGSIMGPSMFGPGMFGPRWAPFDQLHNSHFIEQPHPPSNNSSGIVIRELDEEEHREVVQNGEQRSTEEPHVQDPDEETGEEIGEQVQYASQFNRANRGEQSQPHMYTFQSSRVTYGGVDGAYYTSSTTRRSGSDGISMEESREADTTTGRATHRISRGLHDKGHSVTRRLNSDGRVDTAQMLHNLQEDELPGFEEAWRGNVRQHLPGWDAEMSHGGSTGGGGPIRRDRHAGRGYALPPTEQTHRTGGNGSSRTRIVPIS